MSSSPYDGPGYRRLLRAARRSLERTGGDLTGTVSVKDPDDAERKAIIGITGQYQPEGTGQITVRLADLDRAVREATGRSLAGLLERSGPALRNLPEAREKLAAGRDAMIRSGERSFLAGHGWYGQWLADPSRDGTLTKLVNTGDERRFAQAVRALEALDRRAATRQLAELAATVTGDTHALDHGTTLATLVLRALALRTGVPRPASTEDRRELWDASGVIVDDLASRVLVLGLPGGLRGIGRRQPHRRPVGRPFRQLARPAQDPPPEPRRPAAR